MVRAISQPSKTIGLPEELVLPAGLPPLVREEAMGSSTSEVQTEIKAPMPGTILDVAVKPGQSVKRGDRLCALEAMKMKNAIRSPRVGVIASVEVTEGRKVVFGDVLIRFE